MTYKQLIVFLENLTDEQLNSDVACELTTSDENFSSSNGGITIKVTSDTVGNGTFDNGVPCFMIDF